MRDDWDLNVVEQPDKKVLLRLSVEDAFGEMIDHSHLFLGGDITVHHDSPSTQAEFRIFRDPSITPMVAATARIAPYREILLETAVLELREPVEETDYVPLFHGKINGPGWGSKENKIVLPCLDMWGVLQRRFISTPTAYGSDTSPVALETVIQQLLDANLGVDAPTLVTIGDPNAVIGGIRKYTQQRMRLGEAVMALVNLVGWDIRFLWDPIDAEFKLYLYEPPRAKVTPDHVFTTAAYFDIPNIKLNADGIRNRVSVLWTSSDTTETYTSVDDDASQEELGEVLELILDATGDGQLNTLPKVTALATAVVTDTGVPAVEKTLDAAFFPNAQVHDLYGFQPNNVHYASQLNVALSGYTHRFFPLEEKKQPRTEMLLTGRPKAGTKRWYSLASQTRTTKQLVGYSGSVGGGTFAPSQPSQVTITPVQDGTNLDLTISGNTSTNSMRWFAKKVPLGEDPAAHEPTTAELFASTAHNGQYATPATANNVATSIAEGQKVHVWAVGYVYSDGGGQPGPIKKILWTQPISSAAEAGLSVALSFSSTGALLPSLNGNENSDSWRFMVKKDTPPTNAEIAAATAINGQTFLPATIGTPAGSGMPATALPDELWYLGAIAYTAVDGGGTPGPRLTDQARFGVGVSGIPNDVITAAKLKLQGRSFDSTVEFISAAPTSGNNGKFGWSSGTIAVAGGTSYSITSQAATIAVTGTLYVYLDPAVSVTVLQTTTTLATAIGDGKLFLAFVEEGDLGTGEWANVHPTVGTLQASEKSLVADAVSGNIIRANVLVAAHFTALSVTTAKIAPLSGGGLSIDFTATGSDPVLSHSGFELLANGDAEFSGTLTAANTVVEGSMEIQHGTALSLVEISGSSDFGNVFVNSNDVGSNFGRFSAETGGAFIASSGTLKLNAATYLIFENLPTSSPGGSLRVWKDGSGFLRIT